MILNIDQRELDRLLIELDATDKIVTKALRSTVGRMSSWLKTRAARVVSKELKLKVSGIRKRMKNIKFKPSSDGGAGGVWIGLNPIDLKYLSAVQDSRGVTVRKQGISIKGAFMGPRPGVKSEKYRGVVFKRKGRQRLPIEKQEWEIKKRAEDALDDNVFAGFEAQFYKVFERELKWRSQP